MVASKQIDGKLLQLVETWKKWDKCEKTKAEVETLLKGGKVDVLKACMEGHLSFGTAGMRAPMAAGFNRLNELTMIQISQGLLKYLQSVFSSVELAERGFVIGFDARHNSARFAQLISWIFCRNEVRAHVFPTIVPTPFVSYAVIKLNALAGAMITASHNPKEDNGFKVYWSNGAQILSPHDTGICKQIEANLEPWTGSWDVDLDFMGNSPLHSDPLRFVSDCYIEEALRYNFYKNLNMACPLKFTYTPVHGVGYFYTPKLLEEFGFDSENVIPVNQQMLPDPDFPTAPFPNPEEGEPVLRPAFKTADENQSTIVLANDPDADRFQLAEKQADGKWRVFTGNEMGGLLGWWLWFTWHEKYPKEPASKICMINSVVSSRIVSSIAAKEGFKHEETLTGFKWMANRAYQLNKESGVEVLLCWEESIGYMPRLSLDKDGVLTAAIFAEYASYLNAKTEYKNFSGHLQYLAEKYGHHLSFNSYFICHEPEVIKRIFERLRNFKENEAPPTYPDKCGSLKIKYVRDLTIGYDNSQPNNKPILPTSSSSQMITFTLENDNVFTLRTSGTEPKIKYYIEIIDKTGKCVSQAEQQLCSLKQLIVEHFLQAKINHLKPRLSG